MLCQLSRRRRPGLHSLIALEPAVVPPIPRHFSATRRRTLSLLGLTALPLLPARAATPSRRGAPVFVLNSLDGDVSVIDSITWTEIKRIPTGREPHHLYLTPDEKSVIVA
ncbi:MAG: hypothetical protein KA804_09390, partial [Ottowia sp.]|nr:hypothetical protein [Ottowia sp.]